MKKIAVVTISFFLVFVVWLGIPAYQKDKANGIVRDLCKKDGGVNVFEITKLPNSRFSNNGMAIFPGRGNVPPLEVNKRPEDDFYYTFERTWILPESSFQPAIWRGSQKLIRAKDQKVLGDAVSYSRVGGDPIGPWQPTYFTCPEEADISLLIIKAFAKSDE
jgi:hypothetical protein